FEPSQSNKAGEMATSTNFQTVTPALDVTVPKSKKPNNDAACYDVTVQRGGVAKNDFGGPPPEPPLPLCDYCRRGPGINNPVETGPWHGRSVRLHPRCQYPWADRERMAEDGL